MNKCIPLLLVVALLAPLGTVFPVFASAKTADADGTETLFSSSFEKGDGLTLLQSEPDGDHISSVTACSYGKTDDGGIMSHVLPLSIGGTPDGFSGEGKINLFDGQADTKYCIDLSNISASSPVVMIFGLDAGCTVEGYRLTTANDAELRDPKTWKLYGSTDGESWTVIDSRTNESFTDRKQTRTFRLDSPTPEYSYFKLEVTAVAGRDLTTKGSVLFQLADIELLGELAKSETESEPVGSSPMASLRSNGPTESAAAYTNVGFTGYSALQVYGQQFATRDTYARNVIYDGLSIPVQANTRLSYVIYPATFTSSYDYNHTSKYFAVDLRFTDGSYLSELSAKDQNGFLLDPVSQGQSESLCTMQWNYIESNIGEVAAGKTVEAILVYFYMPTTAAKGKFLTYFDDVTIENRDEVQYAHLSDYISILRGTNNTKSVSRGITVPLVAVPNGFNQYTPANTTDELQPYYYQENGDGASLRHITVNHTASPWLPDANWGVWQMMVNTSIDADAVTSSSDIDAAHRTAKYTHDNEIAKAHYYSVVFNAQDENAPGAQMELTPTSHGAYTRFTYPADADHVNLILGTDHGGSVKVTVDEENGQTVVTSYSDYYQRMYVYSVIDAPALSYQIEGQTVLLSFAKGTRQIGMKLATSYISTTQAQKNLELEITADDTFDSVLTRAQAEWDGICNLIVPEGATYTELVTLYSCLYRMYCYPLLFSENTGTNESPVWKYKSPYTDKVTEGKMYTTNGFWDTYRAEWPAITFLTPDRAAEILNGILLHYEDNGYIARWLGRNGVKCMMGTHSDIILADAYLKGLDIDAEAAFASMLKNAAVDSDSDVYGRAQNATSIFTGYVPNSYENGMSWTVEDYINDYGIYRMAEALAAKESDPAKKAEYESAAVYYRNRALLYPMLYNNKVGFFMGKNAAGSWTTDARAFSPYSLDWYADYAETNAWNMAFSIVHDMSGLAALHGGEDKMLEMLDEYFSEASETAQILGNYTYEQRETRLGLSMFNNQVCYHTAYLYNYFGQPYKTQKITREILSRLYVGSEIGQGYPGDEDNGASSAFYVLTALGLYETSLCTGEYLISSPLYEKVTLNLESGTVTILANGNSDENIYIQSCKVNGEEYNKTYLPYALLTSGDVTVEYQMGSTPSDWGTVDAAPSSLSEAVEIPDYLSDLAGKNLRIAEGEAVMKTPTFTTVYGSPSAALKKLFDNTSDTVALLEDGEALTFAFENPSRVSILTLTSATAASAPESVRVEYSTDGKTWVSLGEHQTNLKWNQYTLPVALPDTDTAYYFLRLTLSGGSSLRLAEIELLGEEDGTSTLTPVVAPADDPVQEPEAPAVEPPVSEDSSFPVTGIITVAAICVGAAVITVTVTALLRRKKRSN
ncbi:MAG: GH92 family glycosyl hydrolase [Clostridia bacterium]|nr:GH92 family glycosyl hydrolase [Clostridia bacterium]